MSDNNIPVDIDKLYPKINQKIPKGLKPTYQQNIAPEKVREKLLEILGIEELPTNINFNVAKPKENEPLIEYKIKYQNSLSEKIEATVITPITNQPNKLAGIVCMGGTAATKESITNEKFYRPHPNKGQLFGWARELARLGYATISISLKGCVERRGTVAKWEQEAKLLSPLGRTQYGYIVEETLIAARILASINTVNPDRIGLTGMSLGGVGAWYGMACDPSISVGAPVCGGIGSLYRNLYEGQPWRQSSAGYIPGILKYFDHGEIISTCITPRPFIMIAPTEDEDMPSSGVDDMLEIVKPAYKKEGLSQNFECYRPPGKHVYMIEYFNKVVSFFNKFL